MSLRGKTVFITGASRGIGQAIAVRAARDGANVVIAAKTGAPDPRVEGTIHSAATAVERAGGAALPLVVDVRDEAQVHAAVEQAVSRFGGIDILVNNASAIALTNAADTPLRRYDLMMDVNVRGTFVCSQACLPHLRKAPNPHILTLSPPLELTPSWFGAHVAYTTSKFAMSMLVLGLAEELRTDGVAANALWPRTLIATAALKIAAPATRERARTPEIMADAAHYILTRESRAFSGRFCIDEQTLREAGVCDFSRYAATPGVDPEIDLFVGR
jgi:citronellol/citronellal dehydrogenase